MNYNLKTFDTIKWLRNRYKARVKDKYILYESELQQQQMMKAVFNSIDRDKSKFLDRSELYDMFIKYGINITKQKLKEFFKSIDQDEDDKLNWTDFKQALKNQEALAMFKQLMLKLREEYECDQSKSDIFVPLSFPQMIQYMNYCVLREETINRIQSQEISNYQKHKQCVNLITLEDSCYRHVQKEKSDDEEEDLPLQSDHAQLVQLKRYQEREQKNQRLEKIKQINHKRFYTHGQLNNNSYESEKIQDLSDMKANISQEINRTKSNIDNFLALINKLENKKPQSRQKSRGTPIMKKNDVLIEAQKEVEVAHITAPPKFKAMKKNNINTRNKILSFKQKQN